MKTLLIATALATLIAPALAQDGVVRIPSSSAQSPILSGVSVPGGTTVLYLSGQVPVQTDQAQPKDSIAAYGDTKAQSITVFEKIKALLAAQNLGMGDVIKLTVFLVGDPKLDGKMDFKGFNDAYSLYFGTADQPNKVARSTLQVSALANPGFLVEIEATAVSTQK